MQAAVFPFNLALDNAGNNNPGEDGDDRDHDQQFNQSEAANLNKLPAPAVSDYQERRNIRAA